MSECVCRCGCVCVYVCGGYVCGRDNYINMYLTTIVQFTLLLLKLKVTILYCLTFC